MCMLRLDNFHLEYAVNDFCLDSGFTGSQSCAASPGGYH